jgi:alkaline phosphatase D
MKKQLNRRDFLAALAAAGVASPALSGVAFAGDSSNKPAFLHGVASGDPLQDRVILWTRVTPSRLVGAVAVQWRIATDRSLRNPVAAGSVVTDLRRDYTVKVDATGLAPGRTYYYGFRCEGVDSPRGRTKTLPTGAAESLRFAFVSCSNFPYGYFNAYRRLAERNDLDFVVHLGDYLYEYPQGGYANPALAGIRDVVPKNEIVTLDDYRLRHALYKTDPDLQELHRQHPMICVWDDHEVANDAWREGAENHNPEFGEGEWSSRRAAATRAYDEYLPIRTSPMGVEHIYRRFEVGDLADLVMLDTRLHGRDLQAAFKGAPVLPMNDPTIIDPNRSLLGFDQEAWLYQTLSESKARGARWRFIGQQVMMAQLAAPGTNGATTLNPDQWDGYAPSRQRLFRHLVDNGIGNNVVMTGDIHSAWCNDLAFNPWDGAAYNPATGKGVVGVEFVAPAVTSPGPIPDPAQAIPTAGALRATSPHMKYVDLYQRGYVLMDADADRVQGEIWHVATVDAPSSGETFSAGFVNRAGANGLQSVGAPSASRQEFEPA